MISSELEPPTATLPTAAAPAVADEECLEWRVHLARRRPVRAAVAVLVAAGAGAWAFFLFQHLVPALAAFGL
ncbi:MAG TPA: hypothetical protein VK689_03440, partial [Armatimonadota bacterium]|nr:hypothetical protein [Armatimonadota bacterium]